jgi:two-component system, NtrC family, nitrogen regulation response regulator GlnG
MTHVSALPVLLVDDDPEVLYSASIVLRTSWVAHVITVEASRAVMPLLAEQEVGVLVLDLRCPISPATRSWSRWPAIIPTSRSSS